MEQKLQQQVKEAQWTEMKERKWKKWKYKGKKTKDIHRDKNSHNHQKNMVQC